MGCIVDFFVLVNIILLSDKSEIALGILLGWMDCAHPESDFETPIKFFDQIGVLFFIKSFLAGCPLFSYWSPPILTAESSTRKTNFKFMRNRQKLSLK